MKAADLSLPPSAAHLPRWGGMPVPYTTEWDGYGHPYWPTITTPEYGLTRSCTCQPERGKPLFTEVCAARHRIAITTRICAFCGQTVEGEMYFLGPPGAPLYRSAPMHEDCCRYSLRICPGLRTGLDDGRPWQIAAAHDYTIVLKVRGAERFIEVPERAGYPGEVTEWLARPFVHDRIPAAEWLTGGAA